MADNKVFNGGADSKTRTRTRSSSRSLVISNVTTDDQSRVLMEETGIVMRSGEKRSFVDEIDGDLSSEKRSRSKIKSLSFNDQVDEADEEIAEKMVRKTTRIYNRHCFQIAGEEPGKRADFMAIEKMKQANQILNKEKRIGIIPGIKVGHEFYARAEMVVVGLHGHWLKGIDYISEAAYGKVEEYKDYKLPIAVSVVMSGRYKDDKDDLEEVVYTGQGQGCDQVLGNGNLALKNSKEQNVPVRVIRGHGKVYTYDGLYNVNDFWQEKGESGYLVYKYKLTRKEGQAPLTSSQVHFISNSRTLQDSRGFKVCDDISGGQEKYSVPAFNTIDNPPVPPTGFTYCKSVILAEGLNFPESDDSGCNCSGACSDGRGCSCEKLNGGTFPYLDFKDGGRLAIAKDVLFECGPNCRCGPKCINRTSQQGLRYNLEVFRTADKGWAVRSSNFIPIGAPVCEYTGILYRTSDLEDAHENDYLFYMDCLETIKGLNGRHRRFGAIRLPKSSRVDASGEKKEDKEPEYCIDAGKHGGVARFINHSCDPNLFAQCVVTSRHELNRARVMLFASDNIPAFQELTYDYGYPLDSVTDQDGKVIVMPCHCGAIDCRKRLF
ncbi:[histone H3]-lysine(4) N-trimethyltransferase [Ranunculus cassubicifolius]